MFLISIFKLLSCEFDGYLPVKHREMISQTTDDVYQCLTFAILEMETSDLAILSHRAMCHLLAWGCDYNLNKIIPKVTNTNI